MPETKKHEIVPMEHTYVLDVDDEQSTLPIDTAAELTKGLMVVNDLLGKIIKESYIEEVEDRQGKKHIRTNFHPLMTKMLDEQRKRVDQIHRVLGGQLLQDIGKETAKITAKMIFEASKNQKSKRNQREKVITILEEENFEDD